MGIPVSDQEDPDLLPGSAAPAALPQHHSLTKSSVETFTLSLLTFFSSHVNLNKFDREGRNPLSLDQNIKSSAAPLEARCSMPHDNGIPSRSCVLFTTQGRLWWFGETVKEHGETSIKQQTCICKHVHPVRFPPPGRCYCENQPLTDEQAGAEQHYLAMFIAVTNGDILHFF